MPCRPLRHAALIVLLAAALVVAAEPADAAKQWRDLNGRVAPDLTFGETALGLAPGTRLASFRKKRVVLLAFWLRDCQHCKRELPKVQRLHDLYGRSGLQVISVCHGFPLGQVLPTMKKRGWTFPVARDPKGTLASYYGGGRRPGFYVVGIDGRIKASNSLAERVIRSELGRWRLAELGAVPSELKAARDSVWAGDYGAALRSAEAVGRKPGASAAVRAAIARLTRIAGTKLQNRRDRAEAWHARGLIQRAQQEYRGIVATFKGTSLESTARALAQNYASRVRGS
ncbi:MAG: TlpA disulfide reductase family protein [Planctomycetota bacterium]|nr:TlpA disulfide reductase family protein [Planctomycetota bacterium]